MNTNKGIKVIRVMYGTTTKVVRVVLSNLEYILCDGDGFSLDFSKPSGLGIGRKSLGWRIHPDDHKEILGETPPPYPMGYSTNYFSTGND